MSKWIGKYWGGETIFASNELYCGKILEVKKGHFSSFHRHKKIEDWLIYSGKILIVSSMDGLLEKQEDKATGLQVPYEGKSVTLYGVRYTTKELTGFTKTQILNKGDTLHISSLRWHLFYALEDSEIFEVSTPDEESERLTESY